MSGTGAGPGRAGRLASRADWLVLAVLAYLPALATAPGVVAADTKLYLTLDPARLLARAPYLWDPSQFGGHVTHQTIGYLWPMGPFFWTGDRLGLPDWIVQRLWIGTVVFAAGAGVRVLARRLGLPATAALVAAVVYQASPFVLTYVNRTSVLLTPWAGLGWITAATVLAVRRGGWRWPAAVALLSATVGGINATSVALVALAPLTWLVHAGVARTASWRHIAAAVARIAVLTIPVNAWWIVPLVVQTRFGADVLAYSETVEAVSSTSSAPEVLRGLGYWLFYGGDLLGRWNSASTPLLTDPVPIALGLGLVVVAVAAVVTVRWRWAPWLATLLVLGTVVAVGAHPPGDPSPWGSLLSGDRSRSTLVLALRSSTRAVPLVALAGALALGALVAVVAARRPRRARLVGFVVACAAVAQAPTTWTGGLVDAVGRRDATVPSWWTDTARRLDADGDATRVLEVPGQEFGAYRWGVTTDALLPGLMERPVLTRDLLPLGAAPLMDLLWALDDAAQAGTLEAASVDPVARLLGAGTVVVRGDAAWERYRTPPGAVAVESFGSRPWDAVGPAGLDVAPLGIVDERLLTLPDRPIAPVLTSPVADPVGTTRVRTGVVVVDGDGAGLVAAAAAGVLAPDRVVVPAAAVDDDTVRRLAADAPVIVTDSNRVRARQWRGSQDTIGMTEDGLGPAVLVRDPADARLPVFPDAPRGSTTTAVQVGGGRAVASGYGSPIAYWPEARAVHAADDDPTTAWFWGEDVDVRGTRWRLDLDPPRPVDPIRLRQLGPERSNRAITAIELRLVDVDGAARTVPVTLDERSRAEAGQLVLAEPGPGPLRSVEVVIVATDPGPEVPVGGLGPVGLVELDAGVRLTEEVRLPSRLAASAGASTPLAVVLQRERVDPRIGWRDDPEAALVRRFDLATSRRFTLTGTARVAGRADDATVDRILGDGTVAADARYAGAFDAGARAAFDDDPATAWSTPLGRPTGGSATRTVPAGTVIDRVRLGVRDDARHSVPTEILVRVGADERRLAVPAAARGASSVVVPVEPALVARTGTVTVTVTAAEERTGLDRRTGAPVALASAVHTVGFDGSGVAPVPAPAATVDLPCRDDLVRVDGRPFAVRIRGPRDGARIEGCEPVTLGAGSHLVTTAAGRRTGIDLDRLVLDTGGPAMAPASTRAVRVERHSPTSATVTVAAGAAGPAWLVWGDGWNRGWEARVDGRRLGPAIPVDGGANGWAVTLPADRALTVEITWAPQRLVAVGLGIGAGAGVVCLALLIGAGRRRRVARSPAPDGPEAGAAPFALLGTSPVVPLAVAPTLALTLGAAVAATVFVGPAYGPLIAGAAALGARRPGAWRITASAAVIGVATAAAAVVARVVISRPGPGFGWVGAFGPVHRPMLAAVLLVGVDAVLQALTRRGRGAGGEPARTAPGSTPRPSG